jgi:hypothetical protein
MVFNENAALLSAKGLLDKNMIFESQVQRLGQPVIDEILTAMIALARWQFERCTADFTSANRELVNYKRHAEKIWSDLQLEVKQLREENINLRDQIAQGVKSNSGEILRRAKASGSYQ